jgi:hypothetical protein
LSGYPFKKLCTEKKKKKKKLFPGFDRNFKSSHYLPFTNLFYPKSFIGSQSSLQNSDQIPQSKLRLKSSTRTKQNVLLLSYHHILLQTLPPPLTRTKFQKKSPSFTHLQHSLLTQTSFVSLTHGKTTEISTSSQNSMEPLGSPSHPPSSHPVKRTPPPLSSPTWNFGIPELVARSV